MSKAVYMYFSYYPHNQPKDRPHTQFAYVHTVLGKCNIVPHVCSIRPDQINLLFHGSGGSVIQLLTPKKKCVGGVKMATSSFVWLSVVVKRGFTTVLPQKFVKIGNYGELTAA